MTAAPKHPSAANFILPFFFSALSLRNSLLCRRSRYQQPALHNAFKLSEHVKGTGKGSLLAGSAQQRFDSHKHRPRLFKSCSPTQVHFSPVFNRNDNFTKKKKHSGNMLLPMLKTEDKNGCHLSSTILL